MNISETSVKNINTLIELCVLSMREGDMEFKDLMSYLYFVTISPDVNEVIKSEISRLMVALNEYIPLFQAKRKIYSGVKTGKTQKDLDKAIDLSEAQRETINRHIYNIQMYVSVAQKVM